jgi:23S rRNA (cytidine1920-2'-O)/16S rRNA (cytidine1409-2'-O)-methyltransferase
VGGAVADKPSRLVAESDPIVVDPLGRRFASRGGDKLEAALERFPIPVAGRRCLDAGASTGGFTDCLLQRGAAHVTAVDVGYGQLLPRLRDDPRVEARERTDIRSLEAEDPKDRFELIVADLSFISLTMVVPFLAGALAAPGADLVLLVKPQFEVGHAEVSRGRGVIRDPGLRRLALDNVASALARAGPTIMGAMASPVLGPAGNAEYLFWGRLGPLGETATDASALLAVSEAGPMLDAAVAASPDVGNPPGAVSPEGTMSPDGTTSPESEER